MKKRESTAVAAFVRFDTLFQDFVSELQPSHVAEWDKLITDYENDPSLPDPYFWKPSGTLLCLSVTAAPAELSFTLSAGLSEAEIRVQLAQEDEEEVKNGNITLHEVTPAAMLAMLLDLEEQQ